MVPFQKGPYGEGGRMRGFLLPLLEEASVVVLVLLLIGFSPSFNSKSAYTFRFSSFNCEIKCIFSQKEVMWKTTRILASIQFFWKNHTKKK